LKGIERRGIKKDEDSSGLPLSVALPVSPQIEDDCIFLSPIT
jgi:hypothetical protein